MSVFTFVAAQCSPEAERCPPPSVGASRPACCSIPTAPMTFRWTLKKVSSLHPSGGQICILKAQGGLQDHLGAPPSAPGLRDGALGPGFRGRRVPPRECKLASLACPRHRWNPNAPLRHPDARWPSPHRTPQPGALCGRRPGKEGAESELSHLLKRFLTRSVRDRGARGGPARYAPPASGREAEGRAETWKVFHS